MVSNQYYDSEIRSVGDGVAEMVEGGVLILFAEPCPEALAEVSLVHAPVTGLTEHAPAPGDIVRIGSSELHVTRVGELASSNLWSLGHVVIYVNPEASAPLLPGAVHATGTLGDIAEGDRITITSGA